MALKTVKAASEDVMQRFAREAQTHGRLQHENIVTAIDSIRTPQGQSFLVMEYVEELTLGELDIRSEFIFWNR